MAVVSRSLIVMALALSVLATVTPTATKRDQLQSRGDGDHNGGGGGSDYGGSGPGGGSGNNHQPTPSRRPSQPKRRALNTMNGAEIAFEICPTGFYGCPIAKAGSLSVLPRSLSEWTSQGFECVDLTADLRACGGCASLDAKRDCTTIPGADEVACIEGGCVVGSCLTGFTLDSATKTCILN